MDEEGALENVVPEIEKGIKPKSKEGGKNEECTKEIPETQKDHIAERKKDLKRHKGKKNKGAKDYEADIKKGAKEGELTVAYGEDGSGYAIDNAEKKRKKREKNNNKNDKVEIGNTKAVEGDGSEKQPEEECVSTEKSSKEANDEGKKKKKKKKKAKRSHEDGDVEEGEKDGKDVVTYSQCCTTHVIETIERKKRKKEKKKSKDNNTCHDISSEAKHGEGDLSSVQQENVPDNFEGNIQSSKYDGIATKELERKKKKYKKKENIKNDCSAAQQDSVDKDSSSLVNHANEVENIEVEHASKRKKKKIKLVENGSDETQDNEVEHADREKNRKNKTVENGSNDPSPNKSNKKVSFSGQDEVFTLPSDSNTEKGTDEEANLVRGKRFTPEENDIVKDAVYKYIEDHDLGDEGLDMVLNCSKHPEVKGCWKEIGSAIPYRPYTAVYYRAQILFRRSEKRKWTREEYDLILKSQAKYGNDWKSLAEELGKHRFHVKDTWRRIKLQNLNKGHWSQGEYQKLFDLVNYDLQLKLSEEKKSKHGMLRDNICWTAISDKLATRPQATCCIKWYKQLTSPMVAQGIWADTDDYRLLDALYNLDATCVEDVDWDGLVEDRSGDVCRKRWSQMTLHIGRHGHKSFAEQVEVLAERYCPHLLEARETWDSKPRVP